MEAYHARYRRGREWLFLVLDPTLFPFLARRRYDGTDVRSLQVY